MFESKSLRVKENKTLVLLVFSTVNSIKQKIQWNDGSLGRLLRNKLVIIWCLVTLTFQF